MIPGIGGLNPKKMQALMRQMGISQEEIPSKRVIIEKDGGGKIIINSPEVLRIKVQGNTSFQISGDIFEEDSSEEDIKTIMEKTGCSEEEAKKALEESGGDLAEAILSLS